MTFWDTDPASDGQDDADAKTRRERPGGLVVVVALVLVATLVGGGWAAAYYGAGENVPRGTVVEGIDVGGLSRADAVDTLREGLAAREQGTITAVVGDRSFDVAATDAGLAVDYEASIEAAGGGRSWDPRRLWDYYTGGDDLDAVVDVDDAALEAEITTLTEEVGNAPRDGRVRLTGAGVREREPRNGTTLDADATREALLASYLRDEPAELALVPVAPEIDAADVQAVRDDFANPALSGAVVLSLDGEDVRLTTAQIARSVRVVARDGALVPDVRLAALQEVVDAQFSDRSAPVDATVQIVDGEPTVVKARPGVGYDPNDLADALLEVVVQEEDERRVEVPATVEKPEVTTKDARDLGIVEVVGEFTTYYPDAEYRNVNIGRAAEIIDGTLLLPGETFSMNDIVGERTRENGFTEGFIISDGILREDLGGGVSQMATTLFNAMYFAGLEDVEHKPHSFYIDRYPIGREATVAWGAIDLRFRNDTDYGVLVQSTVTPSTSSSDGVVTVRLWSTQVWDITSRNSEPYDYTSPQTRVLTTEDCYAYTGSSGFTIDVFRTFRRAGEDEVVRTEKFNTVYTPSDGVECRQPPAPSTGGGGTGGGTG